VNGQLEDIIRNFVLSEFLFNHRDYKRLQFMCKDKRKKYTYILDKIVEVLWIPRKKKKKSIL